MKQFWLVCILTVSLKGNAKPLENNIPADYSFDNQQVLFFMPDFPTHAHHQIPIYNEQTGELVTFVPPSAAKAAYIFINVPREYRDQVFLRYGIMLNISHE